METGPFSILPVSILLINTALVKEGSAGLNITDFISRYGEWILSQDDEVDQLTQFDSAFDSFIKGKVGAAPRINCDGFLNCQFLLLP